jgi:hypothetical protein
MATRGNRPKDPQDIKGGVRGTHGLGDAPREPRHGEVATQGGTASLTGGSRRGGTLDERSLGAERAPGDESSGEELEFELSNAMADVETSDVRAARRERDARAAQGAAAPDEDDPGEDNPGEDNPGEDNEVLGDPRTDREERAERGLETVKTHGPGPKDAGKGTAQKKHLEERGLDAKR